MYSFSSGHVKSRIEEIEKQDQLEEEEGGDGSEDRKENFLSYMIHSGKMSIQEITVNAIDLLNAGIDTVRQWRI